MSAVIQKHNVTEGDFLVRNEVRQMFLPVTAISQHVAIT